MKQVLKRCKKCGFENYVEKSVNKCPQCKGILKKKSKDLGFLGIGFIFDFFFGKLLTAPSAGFNFLILDEGKNIPLNTWYQKKSQNNKNFVSYKGDWGPDWKYACKYPGESIVKVAGISLGNRSADFLKLAQSDGFKMFLEDEPTNPVNKNARKVMASAMIDGKLVIKHIGYLPDGIANKYAGIELNISPKSLFLPTKKLNLGVELILLQRSARYLKKIQN
jgi:hypothetical protein